MRNTIAWILRVMIITAMLLSSAAYVGSAPQAKATEKTPIAIGAIRPAGEHLVAPRDEVVLRKLEEIGAISLNASQKEEQEALRQYYSRFAKQSDTWINPELQVWASEREEVLKNKAAMAVAEVSAIQPVTATVLAMAVDFGATETFTIPTLQYDDEGNTTCVTTTTTISGPRKGEIPQPGPLDNNTLWYSPTQIANAEFYNKVVFGTEGVGRVRYDLTDPRDGQPGINLAGVTVQDYYNHVAGFRSDGEPNVVITGVITGWITVNHSEGYYGADVCGSDSHGGGNGVPVPQLVVDAVTEFSKTNTTFYNDTSADAFWPKYDANHDGIVDTFWLIHAGMGQEGGGGAEGDFSIWAHSSDMRSYSRWSDVGYQVYEGDPGTDDDDIYIGPYTMQPENLDMGVVAEEFGHNFFGLPDLYSTDGENSTGFWNIMASGAWGGLLGGTQPAGMPLWFRMIAVCGEDGSGNPIPCNWQDPMVTRQYDAASADITISQLEEIASPTLAAQEVNSPDISYAKGVRIDLPNIDEEIDNLAGSGKGAWSGSGHDQTTVVLSRSVEVPASGAAVLTIDSAWDIEEDWDYGYVIVNDTLLDDMDGVFRTTNPNSNNLGVGLTGTDHGTLRFDLSAYKGQTVTLGFVYKTDAAATQTGWWIDNVALDGVVLDDFESATEPATFPSWGNTSPLGWEVVPSIKVYHHYYLLELRSTTKYDKMVQTAYVTTLSDEDEWQVERVPYNIPAVLVYYRSEKYPEGYSQRPYYTDLPSYGPKNKLLVVDMNPLPLRTKGTAYFNSRASSYDAGLTIEDTQAFTITKYLSAAGTETGPFLFPANPAVKNFNDAKGYYPGFFFGDPCPSGKICFANYDGSAVIAAKGPYSTRITDFDGNPLPALYGAGFTPTWLGSGNPGDDNVQFGVNVDLLSLATPDAQGRTTATVRINNRSVSMSSTETTTPEIKSVGKTFEVVYQWKLIVDGKEPASNLFVAFKPDAALLPTSLVAEPSNLGTIHPDTLTWRASSALKPGTEVTITLTAMGRMNLGIEPGEMLRTYVEAFDGLNYRTMFYDTPFTFERLYLPDIHTNVQP